RTFHFSPVGRDGPWLRRRAAVFRAPGGRQPRQTRGQDSAEQAMLHVRECTRMSRYSGNSEEAFRSCKAAADGRNPDLQRSGDLGTRTTRSAAKFRERPVAIGAGTAAASSGLDTFCPAWSDSVRICERVSAGCFRIHGRWSNGLGAIFFGIYRN